MSRHRFEIEMDVNDEELAAHYAEYGDQKYPIVATPDEFDWIDLQAAMELGIAENVEIVSWDAVGA